MAYKPLFKVGTMVKIALGSKYYKDPITSVVMGVTKKRVYEVPVEELAGTNTKACAAHPYKVTIGDLHQTVWVDQINVSLANNETDGTMYSPTVNQMSYQAPESVSSENTLKGTVGKDGYNSLVNDPIPNESGALKSAFTLSDKGRQMFLEDEQIKKVIENMGIVNREKVDEKSVKLYTKFDRNGCVDPYNGFVGAKSYTFFTRPDLHIFDNLTTDDLNKELLATSFFADVKDRYIDILHLLQSSHQANRSPFITLLSNTISGPVELPSLTSNRNIETGSNAFGTTITYRGTSHPSDESLSFSIEFTDNRYLETFMYFKIFDEYEKQKLLGRVTPVNRKYIYDKILSDQIAIFRIDVAEDGESILYFAKWTGCIPLSVPTEVLSDIESITGNLNLSVNWHAQFFDDMDLNILSDFNAIVARRAPAYFASDAKDIPLYDPVTNMSNGEWGNVPYIAIMKDTTDVKLSRLDKMRQLKLKWR